MNFHGSSSFLKPTSLICEVQLFFCTSEIYSLAFLIVMDD